MHTRGKTILEKNCYCLTVDNLVLNAHVCLFALNFLFFCSKFSVNVMQLIIVDFFLLFVSFK